MSAATTPAPRRRHRSAMRLRPTVRADPESTGRAAVPTVPYEDLRPTRSSFRRNPSTCLFELCGCRALPCGGRGGAQILDRPRTAREGSSGVSGAACGRRGQRGRQVNLRGVWRLADSAEPPERFSARSGRRASRSSRSFKATERARSKRPCRADHGATFAAGYPAASWRSAFDAADVFRAL